MATPSYDDRWPLFSVSLPRTELSDDEFAAMNATIDRLFTRGSKFALLIDARSAPPLSAKRRKLVGKHAAASFARYPGLMVGMAVVLESALQRGVFTAIHWMVGNASHMRTFAQLAEAEAWLHSRLAESGSPALKANSAR